MKSICTSLFLKEEQFCPKGVGHLWCPNSFVFFKSTEDPQRTKIFYEISQRAPLKSQRFVLSCHRKGGARKKKKAGLFDKLLLFSCLGRVVKSRRDAQPILGKTYMSKVLLIQTFQKLKSDYEVPRDLFNALTAQNVFPFIRVLALLGLISGNNSLNESDYQRNEWSVIPSIILLYVIASLRYHSCTVKFNHLKCTMQ